MPYLTDEQLSGLIKDEVKKQIKNLPKEDVKNLLKDYSLKSHRHQGGISNPINLSDITGEIKTLKHIPTLIPNSPADSVVIYSGTLYFYDYLTSTWKSAIADGTKTFNKSTNTTIAITTANGIITAIVIS